MMNQLIENKINDHDHNKYITPQELLMQLKKFQCKIKASKFSNQK